MPRSRFLVRAVATVAVLGGGAAVPLVASAPASAKASPDYVSDPASLVNPLIGTSNGGDTFPGADLPFGMVQWSPNTVQDRTDGGNYNYGDTSILGYALTNMSGPGCSAEGDIPILPTSGSVGTDPADATSPLDHSDETAAPGYYSLTSNGIDTQLSTTTHAGIGKFTFPSGQNQGNLLFKLSDSSTPDSATDFQVVNDKTIEGYVTTGDFCGASNQYTIHFYMTFNKAFTSSGTWTNGSAPETADALHTSMSAKQQKQARAESKLAGQQSLADKGLPGPRSSADGRLRAQDQVATREQADASTPVNGADGAYVSFDTAGNSVVKATVGLSFVSTANAKANLTQEIPAFNLNTVHTAATAAWNSALGKIQIAGGTASQQATFYTALYHSLLHPNVVSDDNGQYMGFNGQLQTSKTPVYGNYSGWDIYRSQSQLEAALFPTQMSDTVKSMIDDYNQTGMFPKWNENNGEAYIMVGDPADSIIADADAFGATSFNTSNALTDMETEASTTNNIRPGLNYYLDNGYLPIDGTYGCCNYYGPVSTQEEYNAADNSISELASALGDSSVASTYATRANNWQNSYNPESGFLQPKDTDGSFQSGFDPTSQNGFVEADAYVYTAELPFDVSGLIAAEGGDANYNAYLNGLTSSVTDMGATQMQFGDEPSFDIPWEYDYTAEPYQTQNVVREIQDQLYSDTPAGLAGNDDLGAMSSWYVWSALGMYPETPGSAETAMGSPMFTNIAIHLGSGKTITESAPAAADDAPYVQGVSVNGTASDNAYFPASLFSSGGTIDWTLGTTADTSFGTAATAAPSSNEAGLDPALGFVGDSTGQPQDVVTPGSTADLTFGVQSMTTGKETINWTATASSGSGLQVGPASGSINVKSEAQATQEIDVAVPTGTPDGDYTVTFSLQTATGQNLPSVVEDVDVASPGDLSPYFNDTGISADDNQTVANFDGDGYSYSATALANAGVTPGASLTEDGIDYSFPSAAVGTPDSVTAGGQTISVLPVTGATQIGFIGSATNGPSTGTATITYTDGTTSTVNLGFDDWTLNAGASSPASGETEVAAMPYRNTTSGTSDDTKTYLFSVNIPITAGETVQSITLPSSTNQGELHVFAIGSDAGPLTN